MKYQYGERSASRLETCHFDLQWVAREALAYGLTDLAVICGSRTDEEQHDYFVRGLSKLDAGDPRAKHNKPISDAMDIAPWINGKISWNMKHCIFSAGIILSAGIKLGIPLRWGGNWDMDGEIMTDQIFQDLVHFERVI
jgi:peptidoglycan LD-endopeptidase CwlK